MNRERLTILRDHLEMVPDAEFGMRYWDCGTSACIGGWCDRLWPDERAQAALDLSDEQVDELFYMLGAELQFEDVTKTMALSVLSDFISNPDDDALPVWPEKAA